MAGSDEGVAYCMQGQEVCWKTNGNVHSKQNEECRIAVRLTGECT